MQLLKLNTICGLSLLLLLLIPITASAVSNNELPWDWVQLASNGQDVFLGFGTRDPNLGDNIGLQLAVSDTNNKLSPDLDLLYFFDPSDSYSLNVGIGVFANNSNTTTVFNTTYSGGFWYHFDNMLAGIGYHSQQGLTLRYVLKF
jgi:hypothetical protein